jgi:hypothetical protein
VVPVSQNFRTPALSLSNFYPVPPFLSKTINYATCLSFSWFSVEYIAETCGNKEKITTA